MKPFFFLLFLLVIVTGCVQIITPKLPSLSTPAVQLQYEGRFDPKEKRARFSVPPEQLAALILKTAKQEGWSVEETAQKSPSHWAVRGISPDGREFVTFVGSTPSGGSGVMVQEGFAALPLSLFEPLKANVRAYLAGRPFPTEKEN